MDREMSENLALHQATNLILFYPDPDKQYYLFTDSSKHSWSGILVQKYKVNNWYQEIHSITPHIKFKHIKGKENVLADSLSRLRCLGSHYNSDPKESGQEYARSIFAYMRT